MNLKHVLLAPISFLVILYFYFPHFMPDSFNKDIKEMRENIYVTPFGIQFNSRAKDLCNRYQRKFLLLQEIAVEERLDLVSSMKEFHNTIGNYEMDLSEFNELERIKINRSAEDRREKEILRDELIIKYLKNTLDVIRVYKQQIDEVFYDTSQQCDY